MSRVPVEYENVIKIFCERGYSCLSSSKIADRCPFNEKQSDGHCLGYYKRSLTPELKLKTAEVIQTHPEIFRNEMNNHERTS